MQYIYNMPCHLCHSHTHIRSLDQSIDLLTYTIEYIAGLWGHHLLHPTHYPLSPSDIWVPQTHHQNCLHYTHILHQSSRTHCAIVSATAVRSILRNTARLFISPRRCTLPAVAALAIGWSMDAKYQMNSILLVRPSSASEHPRCRSCRTAMCGSMGILVSAAAASGTCIVTFEGGLILLWDSKEELII